MGLYRTEQILDKWQFGDVTIQDFNLFAQTQSHINPSLTNAKLLLAESNEKSPDWVALDKYFLATIAEMGLPKPSTDRLAYIRSLYADEYNALIQSITQDEIAYIAKMDYGQDVDKHILALNQLIFEQNGLITDNQYWYPYEVVELAHYYVEPDHERAFAICNCLIAKNILWETDNNRSMDWTFTQAERMKEYAKLSNDLLGVTMKAMITAFRYQESCNQHYFTDCDE